VSFDVSVGVCSIAASGCDQGGGLDDGPGAPSRPEATAYSDDRRQ